MNDFVVQSKEISKLYKDKCALDHVTMNIKKSSIYGLIGRNGAGKTTMLRAITGMIKPTSGEVELFGKQNPKELIAARKRIGALVNAPILYENMTAVENLEVCRLQRGIPGKKCIQNIMEQLRFEDMGNERVKNFSLGMKQRVGIAMALLSDPELLILDEPTNGLDPLVIVELRKLILKLNKERGTTILISSHNLKEVHEIATHYGILEEGKLIEEINTKELEKKCKNYLHLRVNDTGIATTVLEEYFKGYDFEIFPDGIIKLYCFKDEGSKVNSALVQANIEVQELMPIGEDLEHYFTRRVGEMLK